MTLLAIRKSWLVLGSVIFIVLFLCAFALLNPRLTTFNESNKFRAEKKNETAKGLHFRSAHYEPIKRTGTWKVESAVFQAKPGWKALRSIDAHGIAAKKLAALLVKGT